MESIILSGLVEKNNVQVRTTMRQSAIESGHFMRPKHQVMRDKTKYSRKSKFKMDY